MDNFEIETEEAIEKAIIDKLDDLDIPVVGCLASVSDGTVKQIEDDTYVYVKVDQSSQDGDYRGNRVPHTYSASVGVRYSMADDASGIQFANSCRAVRYNLTQLVGDGCENLSATNFYCDEFMIDSTSTNFEGGENPINEKVYNITIKGRKSV